MLRRAVTIRQVPPPGLRLLAWGLLVLRRYGKADELAARGLRACPGDRVLLDLAALVADRASRPDEAVAKWRRRRDADPAAPRPWWRMAVNLRALGRQAEADALAVAALERFPKDPRIVEQAAYAADLRYDYEAALRLWRQLVARRKVEPDWSQRYAATLIVVGRLDEAAEVLAAARRRHPDHAGLEVCAGLLAAAREDWKAAIAVLARFRARDPENPAARELLGRVLQLRAFAAVDGVSAVAPLPVDVGLVEDEATRTLLLGFESLGLDCEFGLVQRRYGAEPLGLFRWNTTTPTSMLLGLAGRFEGLGDPDHLRLTVEPEGRLYVVQDVRFDFEMHTFVYEGQVDEGRLLDKMRKVLTYLRDRFLVDLESAQKILVFKDPDCDRQTVSLLSAALRSYGPAILLWILPADAAAAADMPGRGVGEVVRLDDRLYAGFLSRPGYVDGVWDVQFDEWVAVCERMSAARRADAVA